MESRLSILRFAGLVLALPFFMALPATVFAQPAVSKRLVKTSKALRAYEIPSFGNGAPALLIDLPDGMKFVERKCFDFDVYTFRIEPAEGNGTAAQELLIYIGNGPKIQWPSNSAESIVCGKQTIGWHFWKK